MGSWGRSASSSRGDERYARSRSIGESVTSVGGSRPTDESQVLASSWRCVGLTEGFIKQQQLRPSQQCFCNAGPSCLAIAQVADGHVKQLLESEIGDDLL
jgi:hypothetical protein